MQDRKRIAHAQLWTKHYTILIDDTATIICQKARLPTIVYLFTYIGGYLFTYIGNYPFCE